MKKQNFILALLSILFVFFNSCQEEINDDLKNSKIVNNVKANSKENFESKHFVNSVIKISENPESYGYKLTKKRDNKYLYTLDKNDNTSLPKKIVINKNSINKKSLSSTKKYRIISEEDICWADPKLYPNINCFSGNFYDGFQSLAVKLDDFSYIIEMNDLLMNDDMTWFSGDFVVELDGDSNLAYEIDEYYNNNPTDNVIKILD